MATPPPSPPHKRRYMADAPVSESKSLIMYEDDDKEFEVAMKIAWSLCVLSPKGKALVKKAMESSQPHNVIKISKSVFEDCIDNPNDSFITQDDDEKCDDDKVETKDIPKKHHKNNKSPKDGSTSSARRSRKA